MKHILKRKTFILINILDVQYQCTMLDILRFLTSISFTLTQDKYIPEFYMIQRNEHFIRL